MTNDQIEIELRHMATKEDLALLKADIAQFKSDILTQLIASERGQRLWIWGLYGLVIISFFVRH